MLKRKHFPSAMPRKQMVVPREFGIREFVDTGEIARGLSPFNFFGAAWPPVAS
jgi:hypothetical protein